MKQDKKINKSLEGPIIPAILTLAIPILVGNLLQSAYQFIDAYWIGKLGANAVAAISVSGPMIFLTISLGLGFAIAGSILISQYHGSKQKEKVDHTAGQTMLTIILAGLFLGGIGFLFTPIFLILLGVEQEVFVLAKPFLQITFLGLTSAFIYNMFQSILRGVGEVKISMYIILGTVILNAIIDPIFIFGFGVIPAFGVKGAAIATVISQSISAIIGLIILFSGKYGVTLKKIHLKPDFTHIKKAFLLGIPSSFEMSAKALGLVMMTFLITGFGTTVVAAYGAGTNIFNFILIPALGLSMATSTMVGQNLGAKNYERATEIVKKSSLISFSLLSFIGILVYIFAPELIHLFIKNDPNVVNIGAEYLRITAVGYGFLGIQFALTGVLRAAGQMVLALILAIVSLWVIQFPVAYILSQHTNLGVNGIWWSFTISAVLMTIITISFIIKGDWKRKKLI